MTMYSVKRRGRTVFAVANNPRRARREFDRITESAAAEFSRDRIRLEVVESVTADHRVIVRNGKTLTVPFSR